MSCSESHDSREHTARLKARGLGSERIEEQGRRRELDVTDGDVFGRAERIELHSEDRIADQPLELSVRRLRRRAGQRARAAADSKARERRANVGETRVDLRL